MNIEVTADWILSKLPNTLSRSVLDHFGDISICSDINNGRWIELVFDKLKIHYEITDIEDDICFTFNYEDLFKFNDDFIEMINSINDLYPDLKNKYDMFIRSKKINQLKK